jgi:hypothetical protein
VDVCAPPGRTKRPFKSVLYLGRVNSRWSGSRLEQMRRLDSDQTDTLSNMYKQVHGGDIPNSNRFFAASIRASTWMRTGNNLHEHSLA